ncbi:MAG: hypothetical protein ORN28_07600 [Rhodoferax sp.]|nr:hypothetical protein [Rhodoferax sp.]
MLVRLLPLILGIILLIAGHRIKKQIMQYSGIVALSLGMLYCMYLEITDLQQNLMAWKALTYSLTYSLIIGLVYILLLYDHHQSLQRVQQLSQQLASQHDLFVGDIHDGVGSRLNNLLWLLRVRKPDIGQIIEEVEQCVDEVRFTINPASSNPEHLHQLLEKLCASIQGAQPTLKSSFNRVGEAENIPANIAINLYKAIQEAFSNAVRHSAARLIEVRLIHQPQQILGLVIDDGSGIPHWNNHLQQQTPRKPQSMGLMGIFHRICRIGGKVNITSSSSGTIVKIAVCLNGD